MKYFLDTEFIESGPHKPVDLISIGIVSEDGREYYAVCPECGWLAASDWVLNNVIRQLEPPGVIRRKELPEIAADITAFVGWEKPEFWGYYSAYDWVVFCQIFGGMLRLPEGWPMYCRDLIQWAESIGVTKLPEQKGAEHHALADAHWNESVYYYLRRLAE